MRSFPLPVRVAAGLAATAVEQARQLPTTLLGLPITAASQALQISMRIQQQVTELAIKGDEVLAAFNPAEEQPSWATFDEDEEAVPEPAPAAEPAEPDTAGRAESDLLAEFSNMSLPQLRGKLRSFSEEQLVELIEHEREHGQRAEILRMLTKRLDRLRNAD